MAEMFAYKARNLSGRVVAGKVCAENRSAAVALLRERDYFVFELKPQRRSGINPGNIFGRKLRTGEMALFCRQFATLGEAGIPLLQCLEILARQTENRSLARILRDVIFEIERGRSLTEAFRLAGGSLPGLFSSVLAYAEASGTLDQSLSRLAEQFEKDHERMERVRSAVTYPLAVAVLAVAAVVALIVLAVPVFTEVFESMGAPLPLPTRVLIAVSGFLAASWYAVPAVVAALVIAVRKCIATGHGKRAIDRFVLRMPVVGKLMKKTITARFARALATLLRSGVPVMQSLEIVESVVGNAVAAGEIAGARALVREGERMAPVFEKGRFFPPLAVNMISIGEESGSLDKMLEKLALFYEREVETMVGRLSGVVEPVLIAGVGIAIGFIALSIYLPVFSLPGVLQGGQVP